MNNFFSCMRSKITKSGKNFNKDNVPVSANVNPELKDNHGILVVKLVKRKHDKGLGLTVSGGIDRGSRYPVISHLRLGGIADRSESLVIGDSILAVNKKKTENLTHQEIVDLLRNAGQHVHLRILYKIPTADSGVSTSCKTAVIQLKKEADGFGIVARESPCISMHGYHPLVVASVRPGSATQSQGVIHVGDRLLAINGQALLGLSRDDALLLLKHAHNQVSLQIEYDVLHKEPVSTGHGSWIIEIEKPAPTVSLGLTLVEDRSGVIVISNINEGGVADRLGVFHKDDQIVSINGTYVKDFSLAQMVELLGKSGSRLKIEFLSVHLRNRKENSVLPDTSRYAKVDTWACSPGECSDDQLSVSTAQDEVTKNGNGGRHCKDRELPETPCSNFKDYDNTSPANITDVSPYEEISEVINQTREHLDLNSEPGSEQEAKASAVEALYSKVRKPRSNSIGRCSSLTGRTSPWAGRRTLSSRRSSFSHTESPLCSRRQLMPPNGRFWSSSSLQSVVNTQMCRLEHVEVNLTADNQGFGLTIAESCVGRQSVLVIAEIECGGPAERSGVLQVNDEILGINDTDIGMMTAEQCNGILQSFGTHANILVGFTVAESVVATSGTFSVKLPKHYFGLGITFSDIACDNDNETSIRISHVRKGSMAYRTGLLHVGDRLVALNGRKMTCVDEAIALIDTIPMGEIVSVTVHKEEEVQDETSGVVYTVELSKQGQNSVGIVVAASEDAVHNIIVASLVPGSVAERSGAVHVGDRILAINDVLIKALSVKDVYQMLDFSGEVVKLRLQSGDQTNQDSTKEKGYKIPEIPEKNLKIPEIPDMTSLHRVSAWAEIFNELDQIVASTTPVGDGAHKRPGNKDGAVKDDGTYVNVSDTKYKIQNSQNAESKDDVTESQITASVCNEVKSGNEDFWETFDALWEGHVSSTKQDEDKESKTDCQKKCEYSGKSKSDVESPAERDKSKTDVVLHGTAITFPRTGSENTDVKNGDHDSTSGTLKGRSISVRYVVREKCVTPDAQISHKDSFERSQSVASGYETDCSTLRSSTNDIVHNGRMSRTETEPFAASIDSFDISNDADDKLSYSPVVKISSQSPISEFLETRTFSVQKSTEHGFGFSLMPDKFKQEVYVASVLPGGPCDGLLQPLDKIIKIDDRDLTQLNIYEIKEILNHGPSAIQVNIVRNPFNSLNECTS